MFDGKIFDVIVAGAGPAGCVLASRLSEDVDKQVLLIEAGPDVAAPGGEHPDVLDPFCLAAINNPAFHWPGLMAQTSAEGHDGTEAAYSPYLQGYGVGGASNINGMGADRGLPGDYDEWRTLGAQGWSWPEVLPYFKKLEHDLDFAGPEHGGHGPMPVRRLPRTRWAPFAATLAEVLQHKGFAFIEDYMTDFRDGFSEVPTNCLPERRVSASMAYLTQSVRGRPNLKVLAGARVDRLSLQGRRANGVYVHVHGVTGRVNAQEVIVACGAIQSPALLMRSGIGPGEHLARHDVAVVQDRPGVGANLQNHPSISLTTFLQPQAAQPPDNVAFLQTWLRFSSHHAACDASDMHLMAFNKAAWHALGRRVGVIGISVLKSYSRGSVQLASAAPEKSPLVRFNLFADSRDEERLVGGVRFALGLLTDASVMRLRHEIFRPNYRVVASLSQRHAWNGFKARLITGVLDRSRWRRKLLAPSRIDPESLLSDPRALRSFVRRGAHVQYHVCGTCRMGRADDTDAVVDPAGRVYGIEGLRVADASIFPTVPRGYTHFIVLMAAEKIAAAIKADWRSHE